MSVAFFLFNGSSLVGRDFFAGVELGAMKYAILFLLGFALLNMTLKRGLIVLQEIKLTTSGVGLFFGAIFTLGVFIPYTLVTGRGVRQVDIGDVVAFGVYAATIVAPVETFFFQFTLPATPIGPIWSQVAFGLFHLTTYSYGPDPLRAMFLAMVLGYMWVNAMALKHKLPGTDYPMFGFAFVTSSHVVFNVMQVVTG